MLTKRFANVFFDLKMEQDDNLIFYSINSYLAHYISSCFYKEHYVWCSPIFDRDSLDEYNKWKRIPVSSSPYHIYKTLCEEIESEDLHSSKIQQNKNGLLKGATEKLSSGVIDQDDFARISKMIELAGIHDFRPLIFLIPAEKVISKLKQVAVDKTANPLSVEYLICDLKKSEFEIIEPRKLK